MIDAELTSRRIASRARLARESAGLSQGHAAKNLGIARSSLAEAEAGNRKISAAELCRMSDIYNVGISWLAGREDSSTDPARDEIELAATELAGLDREDMRTVLQLVKSMRAKDRLKSQV